MNDTVMRETTVPAWVRIIAVVAILLAITLIVTGPGRGLLGDVLQWIEGLGPSGAVVFAAAYILATVLFVPGSILTIGAGFLFGLAWGTVIVSISSTIGALSAFLLGRYLFGDAITRKVEERPRWNALFRAVDAEGFKVVLLARLVPLFPFNLLNYAFGLTKVSWKKYLLASWIGMLPGTVAYVYAGAVAGSLTRAAAGAEPPDWASYGLWALGLFAVIAVSWIITKRARQEMDALMQQETAAGVTHPRATRPSLLPDDAHNRRMVEITHPTDYENPDAAKRYNLVVVGGGTAGLVSAAGAAALGARVALVERGFLGGDCLVYGCVPSKALLRSSRAIHDARHVDQYGARLTGEVEVDFGAVMERLRRLRTEVSFHDAAERFRDLGVDVFFGDATFVGPHAVEVSGRRLRFAKAVVATGARAAMPPIDGLDQVDALTNETIFSLTELPASLTVIGGGPIGCELAQAFARFGCRVTVVEALDRILTNDDVDAAARVRQALEADGVTVLTGSPVVAVSRDGDRTVVVVETADGRRELTAEALLVAVGRKANVDGLGLDKAGVAFTRHGVTVDDRMRTNRRHIYAAGDVASGFQFTHVADAQAKLVLRNALFFGRAKFSDVAIPHVTYTDPELAHVGLSEADARDIGIEVDVITYDFDDLDRAILDGEGGLAKVVLEAGSDRILGATVVARHAGEMISEYTLAMESGTGLAALSHVIHPYPTQAEGLKKPADAYNRARLKPWMKRALVGVFAMRR